MLKIKVDRLEGFQRFKGLNNSELARRLKVSPSLISLVKKGVLPVSRSLLEKLVLLTKVGSIDELFYIEQEKRVKPEKVCQ